MFPHPEAVSVMLVIGNIVAIWELGPYQQASTLATLLTKLSGFQEVERTDEVWLDDPWIRHQSARFEGAGQPIPKGKMEFSLHTLSILQCSVMQLSPYSELAIPLKLSFPSVSRQ